MARTVAAVLGDDLDSAGDWLTGGWTEADFGPVWAIFYKHPFPRSYLSVPDPVAVETLLAAGLLPAADIPGEPIARVRPLPSSDPVASLLASLR